MDSISRAITDDSHGGTRAVDLFNAREARTTAVARKAVSTLTP